MDTLGENRTWRTILVVGLLALMLGLEVVDILFPVDAVGVQGRALPRMLRLGIFAIMLVSVVLEEHEYALGLSFGFSILLLGLVMGASVAVSSDDLRGDLVELSKTYYWVLGFFFIAEMTRQGVMTHRILVYFTLPLVILLFGKIAVMDVLSGGGARATAGFSNEGWKLLLCLPLVMLFDSSKKMHRYAGILLIVVGVFISVKRGAILAMAAAMGCWFVASVWREKRMSLSNIAKIVAMVAVAGFIVFSRLDSYANRLSDITTGDSEQFGSGRGLVYGVLWQKMEEANAFRLIFGHGYLSVRSTLGQELGHSVLAHNDFLELFHDHGLIGILVFYMMFISLLRFCLALSKTNPPASMVLLCATIILFIKSVISIAIFTPTMIYMAIALGYVRGKAACEAGSPTAGDLITMS